MNVWFAEEDSVSDTAEKVYAVVESGRKLRMQPSDASTAPSEADFLPRVATPYGQGGCVSLGGDVGPWDLPRPPETVVLQKKEPSNDAADCMNEHGGSVSLGRDEGPWDLPRPPEAVDLKKNEPANDAADNMNEQGGNLSLGGDAGPGYLPRPPEAVDMHKNESANDAANMNDHGGSEENRRTSSDHLVARRWEDMGHVSDELLVDVSSWHTFASKSEIKIAKAFSDTFSFVGRPPSVPGFAWCPKSLQYSAVGDGAAEDEDEEKEKDEEIEPVMGTFGEDAVTNFVDEWMRLMTLAKDDPLARNQVCRLLVDGAAPEVLLAGLREVTSR